jgi:RHS repeat-associated protein
MENGIQAHERRAIRPLSLGRRCGLLALLLLATSRVVAVDDPVAACGPSEEGSVCGGAGVATLGNTSGVNTGAGNPINLITGNKYLLEADMPALSGELGLEIVRHYNSVDRRQNAMGFGWRLSYDTEIVASADKLQILEADGHRVVFDRDPKHPSACAARDPANGKLIVRDTGQDSGYLWVMPNGRRLRFDSAGRLQSIQSATGALLTMTRAIDGTLLAMTDPLHREMRFEYANILPGHINVITAIETPIGKFAYRYDNDPSGASRGNLLSVSKALTTRRYHYEPRLQAQHPHALTGMTVERRAANGAVIESQRLATYVYRADGRAALSMRGAVTASSPLDEVFVDVATPSLPGSTPGHTTLLNSRNERTSVRHAVIGGEYRILEIRGPSCARCAPGDTRFGYDTVGRLIERSRLSASGDATDFIHYERDALGRVVRVTARGNANKKATPAHELRRFQYEGTRRLPSLIVSPSVVPGREAQTQILYDPMQLDFDRPVAIIQRGYAPADAKLAVAAQEISRITRYRYDSRGRLATIAGPLSGNDGLQKFSYDLLGRLSEVSAPGRRPIRIEYDAISRPRHIEFGDGLDLRYAYDESGRVASVGTSGRTVRFGYDLAGRVSRVTQANGETLLYDFDAAGRVANIADTVGNLIQLHRDTEGQLLARSLFDSRGQLTRYSTDASTNAQAASSAMDAQASLRLVADGLELAPYRRLMGLIEVKDSRGVTNRIVADDFGRVVRTSSPDAGSAQFIYDAADRVVARITPRGDRFDYGYDSYGRLVWEKAGSARTQIYYGANGRPSRIVFPEGEERFSYDSAARLLQHARKIGANWLRTQYFYDKDGRLMQKRLPDNQVLRYRYNELPHPYAHLLAGISRVDLLGETSLLAGLNSPDTTAADARFKLLGGVTYTSEVNLDGSPRQLGVAGLWHQSWAAGGAGTLSIRTSSSNRRAASSADYSFDKRGRLRGIVRAAAVTRSESLRFDASDNRISKETAATVEKNEVDPASNRLLVYEVTRSPAKASQRVKISYDAAGSVESVGARRYVWDEKSRLIAIAEHGRPTASYGYNAVGERIRKTVYGARGAVTTYYLYEAGRLAAEANGEGHILRQYVWLGDQPIALIAARKTYGIVADASMAPRVLIDNNGHVVWRSAEDLAEANAAEISGAIAVNLRGSHQYYDAESGLYYNTHRYFAADLGRYLSVDPLGLRGAGNPYSFASENPLGNVDLLGLQSTQVTNADVRGWSFEQQLRFVFDEAARRLGGSDGELASALRALVAPEQLATTASIFAIWSAAQFTPFGWAFDLAVAGLGIVLVGESIMDVVRSLYRVAAELADAACESDLRNAGRDLAQGMSAAVFGLAATTGVAGVSRAGQLIRMLRSVFERNTRGVTRSAARAATNADRFGRFDPGRGAYLGASANQGWITRQRGVTRSDAHPPWAANRVVVDSWLNPGRKIYMVQVASRGPGGWATTKLYSSMAEARRELGLLDQFKGGNVDIVLQEYTVTAPIPVRQGTAGPQISGWPTAENLPGGGPQLEFLLDWSQVDWRLFLQAGRTMDLAR